MREQEKDGAPTGITRRTVTKAAVWAVPAVAVAAAVPIASASVPCVAVTAGGSGCKWPGSGNNWSYDLQFCYQNNCGKPVQVKITSITNNAGKGFTACTSDTHIGLVVTLNPGQQVCYGPWPYSSTASAAKIEIYGQIAGTTGVWGPVIHLAEVPAPVQDCSGSSPCA